VKYIDQRYLQYQLSPLVHIFYGLILAAVALTYALMQLAVNPQITHLSKSELQRLNKKNWIAVVLYALSIPLSLIHIYLSTAIFILLPSLYFLPSKKLVEPGA
jgi:uncharacterized membrane protein